jgi:hypothetical protein
VSDVLPYVAAKIVVVVLYRESDNDTVIASPAVNKCEADVVRVTTFAAVYDALVMSEVAAGMVAVVGDTTADFAITALVTTYCT